MTEFKWYEHSTVELIAADASDMDVARAAWVSTKGEEAQTTDQTKIEGLINYLVRDKHGSPFEHNYFKFLIKTPIFTVREFQRHRIGWSYNEESGRYSQMKPHFYVIGQNRNLTQTGKPGHYQFSPGTREQYIETESVQMGAAVSSYQAYQTLLEQGVAKEVARMHLPLNLMTSFYATCNARSLMNLLSLRTKDDRATFISNPQWEINEVANQIEAEFARLMPITHAAYNKNGRVAP